MSNLQNLVTDTDESKWIINEYGEWLQNQVHCIDTSLEDGKLRKALAGGLSCYGRRMKGLMINGYKFQTIDRVCRLKTQNSGVMVEADGETYYGKVKDIFELNYYGDFRVILFRCDWVDIRKV
ncbi:tRNA dimethylallyltransferase 1 [Bienertia sinuspersici]